MIDLGTQYLVLGRSKLDTLANDIHNKQDLLNNVDSV